MANFIKFVVCYLSKSFLVAVILIYFWCHSSLGEFYFEIYFHLKEIRKWLLKVDTLFLQENHDDGSGNETSPHK